MEPSEEQVAIERDRRDLEDIVELKKNSAFTRYFMRRLAQKKADAEKSLKYDKLKSKQRERVRVVFLAFEELEKMLDVDEGSIKSAMLRRNQRG